MNVDAFAAVLLIFALAVWFYGPWREWCTANARQVIFEKRDAIFDLAMSGELDFRSEEYKRLRRSMEQVIRFAHELTLGRWLVFRLMFLSAHDMSELKSEATSAIAAIKDPATRKKVEQLEFEVSEALVWMLVLKSPVLALVTLLLALLSGRGTRKRQVIARVGELAHIEAKLSPQF